MRASRRNGYPTPDRVSRSRSWLKRLVNHVGAGVPGVLSCVAEAEVGVRRAAVFDGDAGECLTAGEPGRLERPAFGMIDFEVLDVEAESVGVSPELQAVSARLPH